MKMRAKLKLNNVQKFEGCEVLTFNAVCKNEGYPADGSDENNTFARWTPNAELKMTVNNPALLGVYEPGQEFYVDFTPVVK
jgi:hypothetical protein